MDDLDAFAAFLAHPTATQYMAFTADQKTRGGAEQMLRYVIDAYESDSPIFSLTVADAASDAYLGSCGLQPLTNDDGVEVYYTIVPEHQGRGLATEAMRAVLAYAAHELGITRFVAFVVPENAPSVRVAEKLGFVDDGPVERQAATGELTHDALVGRRYVLERSGR